MVISPKAYTATLNWKAVCGESRTHGLERAVEGQPSTATLRFTGLKDSQDYSGSGQEARLETSPAMNMSLSDPVRLETTPTEQENRDRVFSKIDIYGLSVSEIQHSLSSEAECV